MTDVRFPFCTSRNWNSSFVASHTAESSAAATSSRKDEKKSAGKREDCRKHTTDTTNTCRRLLHTSRSTVDHAVGFERAEPGGKPVNVQMRFSGAILSDHSVLPPKTILLDISSPQRRRSSKSLTGESAFVEDRDMRCWSNLTN